MEDNDGYERGSNPGQNKYHRQKQKYESYTEDSAERSQKYEQ